MAWARAQVERDERERMLQIAETCEQEYGSIRRHARAFMNTLPENLKFTASGPSPTLRLPIVYRSLTHEFGRLSNTEQNIRHTLSEIRHALNSLI